MTKLEQTKELIREWYDYFEGQVYVSFSGGIDSTVLLHLVRELYPEVPGLFLNTGVEFPEILEFVRTKENITWIKPKMSFKAVLEKYGYPVISKQVSQQIHEIRNTKSLKLLSIRLVGNSKGFDKLPNKWFFLIDAPFKISPTCCDIFKKRPDRKYAKETGRKPFIGMRNGESRQRLMRWKRLGCNAFTASSPKSNPLSLWTHQEILNYISTNNLRYSSIYDKGYDRTGCMYCAFGAHIAHPNKFQILKKTHPKQYQYAMEKLGMREVLDFCKIPH